MVMDERDAAAVSRARTGDVEAFRELVERHSRDVFRLACRLTGSEHDAEDVVQETFLRAHRQLGRFEERASFATWLYRIAVNCSHDLMRRRRRLNERHDSLDDEPYSSLPLPDDRVDPDRQVFSAELRRKVVRALSSLSHMERAAVVLRHYEGLSIGEIGQVLGLGESAAKHSVFRGVQKMRKTLEPIMSAVR